MGKIGGSSWLNAVKKAFRSPTKDTGKTSSRRRSEDNEQEEEKKRGKRRWIFSRPSPQETTIQHNEAKDLTISSTSGNTSASSNTGTSPTNPVSEAANAEQRRAIAVAMATAAAAEAAVATAQAAVEVIRLTRPSILIREYAAIAIQTSFRGYLARRALRALKGLVKLQALVRGHNVRKRAKMTLQCMQALVRAQVRVRDQRKRLSLDSAFGDPNCLRGSHLADRKSLSRESRSDAANDWHDHLHTVEEIQANISQKTKEAALKRERTLAYAFSHQMWRSDKDQSRCSEELEEEKPRLLDQWMMGRTSCDQREAIKTVEIDTYKPYSNTAPNFQRPQNQNHHHHYYYQQEPRPYSVPSPLRRTHQIKTKPLQVHSSPRSLRAERDYPKAQTPTLRSSSFADGAAASVPNYMAATVSAKARIRSQSAPRQRAVTPERENLGSAKKRLSFPVPEEAYNGVGSSDVSFECNSLRSPSCKSIYRDQFGMEQRPNMCFCDEVSSPSTSGGVRRWLKRGRENVMKSN